MHFLEAKKVHFIGIGGIGVSALAKLCHKYGIEVTGSDLKKSEITEELEKKYQIDVNIGQHTESIQKTLDFVIYSPAVPKNDEELQKALSFKIPTLSYPEALGLLSEEKYTIAVAGTNGKTTTTSMLVEAIREQGVDPTVIVGGILQKFHSNFLAGNSHYFITEACEYKRSFLNIKHNIAVITNITEDHLDYFHDLPDIQSAFIEFIDNHKDKGILVCNTQLENLSPIVKHAEKNNMTIIDYSPYLDKKYKISIPGEYNQQNLATALAILEAMNLDVERAHRYLSQNFSGVKRRMEHIGYTQHGAKIYDDYAHNPEGIQLLLEGLRSHYPNKKIVMLFEPHLYSRTEDFKEAFGEVLSRVDVLYLFPVYEAREQKQREKDFLLKDYIRKKENFYMVEEVEKFQSNFKKKQYNEDYIVITVGAGEVWRHGLSVKVD